MDFMSDELYNGQRSKLFTLVDNFTRESLAIGNRGSRAYGWPSCGGVLMRVAARIKIRRV